MAGNGISRAFDDPTADSALAARPPRDSARLKEAKRLREVERTLLARCECEYPIVRMRNASGHAPDCPAHAYWMVLRNRRLG